MTSWHNPSKLDFCQSQKGVSKMAKESNKHGVESQKGQETELALVVPEALKTLQLPKPALEKLRTLYEQMQLSRPGIEVDIPWAPPIIRIKQASSVSAPDNIANGELYADTGLVLKKPWSFYVLYAFSANMKLTEDDENNIIICRSEDGIVSNRGIKCNECPDAPFKSKEMICRKGLEFFVIDSSFENIFKLTFRKTNYRIGAKLLKQITAAKQVWLTEFALSTEQATSKNYRYYIYRVNPTGKTLEKDLHPAAAFLTDQIAKMRAALLEKIRNQTLITRDVLENNSEADSDLPI